MLQMQQLDEICSISELHDEGPECFEQHCTDIFEDREKLDEPTDACNNDLNMDQLSQNLPCGTIFKNGEMVEFVSHDLIEKIKKSTPLSKSVSGTSSSQHSSQWSIESVFSTTSPPETSDMECSTISPPAQSPDAAPPIDPQAIRELEVSANRMADGVARLLDNLHSNLHKMSAITVGCLEAYKTSVDITCNSVDLGIKSMYTLMAKCEELNNAMAPAQEIASEMYLCSFDDMDVVKIMLKLYIMSKYVNLTI